MKDEQRSSGQGGHRQKQSRPARQRHIPPKSKRIDGFLNSVLDDVVYIVFDVESTGGNPERNAMTEICALKYQQGEVVDQFYSLINPKMPIPPIVRKMTGIDNKMVRNAPPIEEVMPKFVEFIGTGVLVSHNTIGDMKFLRHYSQKTTGRAIDNYFLCTHLLVEKLAPEAPNRSLKGLGQFFKFVPKGALHRADADAYMTLDLFLELKSRFAAHHLSVLADAIRFQGDYESGVRLGWAVDAGSLQALPSQPGVLCLYDRTKGLHLAVALFHMRRDVSRLLKYPQLPKGMLRLILNTYSVEGHASSSVFAAVQAEASMMGRHPKLYDPTHWHQRVVSGINLFVSGKQIEFRIGELTEGTFASFGQIHDRRETGEFLAKVIAACEGESAKRMFVASDLRAVLYEYFSGRIERKIALLKARQKKLWYVLFSSKRKQLERLLRIAERLQKIPIFAQLQDLLEIKGLIVVRDLEGNECQIYRFINGRHFKSIRFEGGPEELDHDRQLRLVKSLKTRRYRHKALTASEARHANASLWWIFNNHRGQDGQFIPYLETL